MKKTIILLSFFAKAFLLVLLLLFGWVFINVTNLVKGKKSTDKDHQLNDLFGADEANAGVPTTACPHVAYFDGRQFKIENDFLCESLRYFPLGFDRLPYKDRFLRPDLLKLTRAPRVKDGGVILQFQENEEEESFIKWFKVIRVMHPRESEVLVNSDFNSFQVWDSAATVRGVVMPSLVTVNGANDITRHFSDKKRLWKNPDPETDVPFEKNTVLEFTFRGLKSEKAPYLIVKSVLRDWMVGEENRFSVSWWPFSYSLKFNTKTAVKALAVLVGGIYFMFEQKSFTDALAFFPIVFGLQSKSIRVSCESASGNFELVTVHKPRAWNYGTEVISLPLGAIKEDGTLRLRAEFTKRHKLCFAGVLQDAQNQNYRKEELVLANAVGSRLGNVTESFLQGKNYTRMVPGDKIDLTFENPAVILSPAEKETYLLQTFGYYTALSEEGKMLAGNWREKISEEARERLAALDSAKKS